MNLFTGGYYITYEVKVFIHNTWSAWLPLHMEYHIPPAGANKVLFLAVRFWVFEYISELQLSELSLLHGDMGGVAYTLDVPLGELHDVVYRAVVAVGALLVTAWVVGGFAWFSSFSISLVEWGSWLGLLLAPSGSP